MRALLCQRWRQDRLPLLLYLITFIVMTYPFVLRMHDSLALHNTDTFKALWQNWWLREALIQGHDINFTESLFHPQGLDISLDARRWATFPLWALLYTLVGEPLAYNLVAMIGVLFKAYGMYLFGLTLFQQRIPAWVTGAFYAFAAPALVFALRQPNTGATDWIPWFMLALVSGLKAARETRPTPVVFRVMTLAGICFALNVYMNLKIAIFAMLLGGGYILWALVAHRLWAKRLFWIGLLVFSVSATVLGLPLLIQTLGSDQLQAATSWPVIWHAGVDPLNLFRADFESPPFYRQVIATMGGAQLNVSCLCLGMTQMGFVAAVAAAMGALYILRFRRNQAIWILLSITFVSLSLGVVIFVNRQPLDIYWTPFRVLEDLLLFRVLILPYRLILVFLFPFSILVGYGFHSRLNQLRPDRSAKTLLTLSIIMLLYGTSVFPLPVREMPRPAYISVLNSLPEGAVIDLPMGRDSAKFFMAMQTRHQRPIVEGMLPRTPPSVFAFIEANPVLKALSALSTGQDSAGPSAAEWPLALSELRQAGFRYLVVHREVPVKIFEPVRLADKAEEALALLTPIYADDNVRLYDLRDWGAPYPLLGAGGFTHLPDSDGAPINIGDKFTVHNWSLLDPVEVRPCQKVAVESWWSIAKPDTTPHSLLLILAEADGDGQLGIAESVPAHRFTSEWHAGVYYRDRSAISIPCAMPAGSYPLLLGMKETMSGKSLPIYAPDGSLSGSLHYLTTIHVEAG